MEVKAMEKLKFKERKFEARKIADDIDTAKKAFISDAEVNSEVFEIHIISFSKLMIQSVKNDFSFTDRILGDILTNENDDRSIGFLIRPTKTKKIYKTQTKMAMIKLIKAILTSDSLESDNIVLLIDRNMFLNEKEVEIFCDTFMLVMTEMYFYYLDSEQNFNLNNIKLCVCGYKRQRAIIEKPFDISEEDDDD